jgi:D-3-phosphoglycerate dehydrogenase
VIDAAPRLKLIQQWGVGLEGIDVNYATRRGVYVANVVSKNAVSVAEHAFFLMLALAKNYRKAAKVFEEGRIGDPPSHEIDGKTLGILGLGASGVELAKRAKYFGMRVIAMDVRKSDLEKIAREAGISFLGGREDLDIILKEADYLSVHTPLTPETRGMIGLREFEKMKRTAFIVNTARGPIIDEEALYHALKAGKIRGAGLDVYGQEPPDPGKPLFQLDNLIVTPHIAGVSYEAYERVGRVVAENVERVARGELPLNLINVELLKRERKEASST